MVLLGFSTVFKIILYMSSTGLTGSYLNIDFSPTFR